jgi:hypothetical protein
MPPAAAAGGEGTGPVATEVPNHTHHLEQGVKEISVKEMRVRAEAKHRPAGRATRFVRGIFAYPAGAVYGKTTVTTPLFDFPLAGNVYLRSSDNLLPDLVPDLRGPAYLPIKVESAGKTDSIHGGIRNTFSFIPDAPFSKLVTKLPGGGKGLLENSRDICAKTYHATVRYTAHNGLTYTDHPELKVKCKQGGRHRSHSARAGGGR